MSTPAAKRIRLDSSTTIHKPFKSPFKTPRPDETNGAGDKLNTQAIPDSNLTPTPYRWSTPTSRARVRFNQGSSVASSSAVKASIELRELELDPAIAPLLKAQRALEQQIREVREQLDTAEQARQIELSSAKFGDGATDGQLVDLIEKWRGVSQSACDELFVEMRDKINGLGGLQAWRKSEKENRLFSQTYHDTALENTVHNNESKDNVIEEETENERYAREEIVPVDDDPEDDFDMGSMLRRMNIDVNIIGYDTSTQSWKEHCQ